MYHKLLIRQLKKHFPPEALEKEEFKRFLESISGSYQSFDQDKELMERAFSITETEYQEANTNLNKESELRLQSLEKLKEIVFQLVGDQGVKSNFEDASLVNISEYIQEQVAKNKKTEDRLNRTINLFKKSESKLKIQEEKYRNIIANMNLGILEVDTTETIQYANQSFADIVGFSVEELIGKKTYGVIELGYSKKVINEKASLRSEGISDNYEVQVTLNSGEKRWWFISGAPNYNDKGELTGSIGIHLDITEKKQLEIDLGKALRKAEEASKAKEAFLANMSHEIRTPLNAIIGMIRELSRGDKLTIEQESYLNHTDTAAKHLLSILNSILDISKIEAGELELESEVFSLGALTGNIKSILYNKAQKKSIGLEFKVSKKLHPAHIGDSARIRQILLNLLGNSLKFTMEGFILLAVLVQKEDAEYQDIRMIISDTGIGMDEAFLNHVFSKFTQEEKSTSRRFGGTGLGMSITYEIVQLMGGTIQIESKKGKGTKITIDFTLKKGESKQLAENNTEIVQNSLVGIKVLLVEDNMMNRFIAIQSLSYFGCLVDEAENGYVALEKLQNNDYDLILMDIQMPEMDGVETTKVIRNDLKNDIPIIALTANAFKKDINTYLSIGMNDYVTKPFEESLLYEAISIQVNAANIYKEQVQALTENDKLYDLSKLELISRGDQVFINEMVNIFIKNTPATLDEMQEAFEVNNFDQVSKLAHRLKPSVDNMGIKSLEGVAADIELYAKSEGVDPNNLEEKIMILVQELDSVLAQIRADFG